MSDTVTLTVQEGGSFVLECNPRTNDPSVGTVSAVWTKDHVCIGLNCSVDDDVIFLERGNALLVRNFSSSGGGESVTFQCLLRGFRYLEELKRKFIITPAKGQPKSFVYCSSCMWVHI